MNDNGKAMQRREFLRKAAVTGAAAAWAAPVVQSIAASPAYAQAPGTPAPAGCCVHGQCVEACQQSGDPGCGNSCELSCSDAREPGGGGLCRRYDSVGYRCIFESCNPNNWTSACAYTGPRFTLDAQEPPPCHPTPGNPTEGPGGS